MTTITHITTDKNTQDETTNYWFEVDGESWAVSDRNGEIQLLDCNGCPVTVESRNDHDGVLELLTPFYVTERDARIFMPSTNDPTVNRGLLAAALVLAIVIAILV